MFVFLFLACVRCGWLVGSFLSHLIYTVFELSVEFRGLSVYNCFRASIYVLCWADVDVGCFQNCDSVP